VVPGLGALAVVADGPGAPAIAAAVQSHLFGAPVPRPAAGRGTGADLTPAACAGRYRRHHITQEVEVEGDGLVATTTPHGPVADLFPDPPPLALQPRGGGRYSGQHPYEDFPTVWDFGDAEPDGRAATVLVDRLCLRDG